MFSLDDVRRVADAYPFIKSNGLHSGDDLRVDDELVHMVNLCAKWLEHGRDATRDTARRSSYGLKHRVEAWCRAVEGSYVYIGNSAFIIAALLSGWGFRRPRSVPEGYINAFFKRTGGAA